jgi:hypothetical protein
MSAAQQLLPPLGATVGPQFEQLVRRLPARRSASIQWVGAAIRRALQPLITDPLTNETIAVAASEHLRAVWHAVPILWEAGPQAREIAAAATDELIASLPAAIKDDSAADSALWAWQAHRKVAQWWVQTLGTDEAVATEQVRRVVMDPTTDALLRGRAGALARSETLLAAVFEAVQAQALERAAELAHRACLDAIQGIEDAVRMGLQIQPFDDQTAEERAARTLRYSDQIRENWSVSEFEAVFGHPYTEPSR